MSQHHHSHRRTLSAIKTAPTKGQRPAITRAQSSPKVSSLGKKRTTEIQTTPSFADDDDDDMATTFLQYCPTCEKQIVVPNNSILYCSESCRRKDAATSSPTNTLPPSPIMSPTPSMESTSPRTIVPLREPSTLASFGSKPPLLHNAKSDLDPTEWKPDLPRPSYGIGPGNARTRSSAALAYLAQFHRSPSDISFGRRTGAISSRPSTGTVLMAHTAPGLSRHSIASTSSDESEDENSEVGTPDTSQDGRAPRLHIYSASDATLAAEAKHDVEAGLMWQKTAVPSKGDALDGVAGSLKKLLLAGEADGM